MGGKNRIAKYIVDILNKELEAMPKDTTFVSPFFGAGNVEQFIQVKKILNDKHPYLMYMWQDLKNGRKFPNKVTEEDYQNCKTNKDLDKGLAGFILFGCSWSAKWEGGYARDGAGKRNYAQEAVNGLEKKINNGLLNNATLSCKDYKELEFPKNSLIYVDPPYQGTTPFCTKLLGKFNHEEFWNVMEEWSKENHVFISEFNAPPNFECIWSKPRKLDMANKDGEKEVKIEKLFKLKK